MSYNNPGGTVSEPSLAPICNLVFFFHRQLSRVCGNAIFYCLSAGYTYLYPYLLIRNPLSAVNSNRIEL